MQNSDASLSAKLRCGCNTFLNAYFGGTLMALYVSVFQFLIIFLIHFFTIDLWGPEQLQHRNTGRQAVDRAASGWGLRRGPGPRAPVTGCWKGSSWLPPKREKAAGSFRNRKISPVSPIHFPQSVHCCFVPSVYLSLWGNQQHPTPS